MDLSFCKLKSKDVINMCDGKNLGNISDIIIDTTCGKILGLIVPSSKNFFSFFKSSNDIFIPYNRICKIGKDIILVDIIMQQHYNCEFRDTQCCNTQNNNYTPKLNIQQVLDDIDLNNSK